jgi:hypothetical protein
MQLPFRKLLPAALAVGLAAVPVGLAAAASGPPASGVVSPTLRTPLAGDATAAEAMRDHTRDRLVREHARLARKYADLTGRRHAGLRTIQSTQHMTRGRLIAKNRELRAEVRELDIPIPPSLKQVAECESHGNPRAVGGGGSFRGAFQFMESTWHAVGGEGDPADAPLEEQYRRAAILMARSGSSPWPVCGG